METSIKHYSMAEEIANSITHGIGIVLAIAALGILTTFAGIYGNAWHIVSVSIYGTTLVLLIHGIHALPQHSETPCKKHSTGSGPCCHIPAHCGNLHTVYAGESSWAMGLVAIWRDMGSGGFRGGVATVTLRRWGALSLALYIGMGWVVVVAIKPLIVSVATGGIVFLVLGGLAYTAGILFYCWKKLKYHHAIWHLFVLAGSILHFFSILFYVVPISS